jgi:hypothetical protein
MEELEAAVAVADAVSQFDSSSVVQGEMGSRDGIDIEGV